MIDHKASALNFQLSEPTHIDPPRPVPFPFRISIIIILVFVLIAPLVSIPNMCGTHAILESTARDDDLSRTRSSRMPCHTGQQRGAGFRQPKELALASRQGTFCWWWWWWWRGWGGGGCSDWRRACF